MHFSHLHHDSGSKAGKFALVAGLHAVIAIGVVNMMNAKVISLPRLPEDLTVFMTPEPPAPPLPPPEPPRPLPQVAPPEIVVPKVEVEVPPPPIENPVQTTTEVAPAPQPAQPAQAEAPVQSSNTSSNSGAMRSIALAEASGCATPEYPARAARNNESGTVTLALLIGTDGRVANARVQKSSGSRDLDKAALNALSMCQFKPGMNNGVPEAGWGQIAYVWKLQD
ncbi:energy transducer TonB [Telluria sp. B2]